MAKVRVNYNRDKIEPLLEIPFLIGIILFVINSYVVGISDLKPSKNPLEYCFILWLFNISTFFVFHINALLYDDYRRYYTKDIVKLNLLTIIEISLFFNIVVLIMCMNTESLERGFMSILLFIIAMLLFFQNMEA